MADLVLNPVPNYEKKLQILGKREVNLSLAYCTQGTTLICNNSHRNVGHFSSLDWIRNAENYKTLKRLFLPESAEFAQENDDRSAARI